MSDSSLDEIGQKFAMASAAEQAHWQAEFQRIVAELRAQSAEEDVGAPGQQRLNVGKRLPRPDVLYKVRGKARYAANISVPGMLHGAFVRSREPHARILGIDLSRARSAPGVCAILTADDIAPERLLIGTHENDTPVLAKDRVRHVGEPIVAIAAESLAAAEAACNLVDIQYEPLPAVLSPEEALAPGAALVDPEGNVLTEHTHTNGDVERGLREADIVLEETFTTEPIDHCFMEAQSGIAFLDADGVLTLLASTQYPHYHHKQLARVTGLPLEKVRVIQTVVGGAFGGKIDNTIECAACLFALKTGRPVKMALSREEVFTSTTKRHRTRIRQRLGATRDGRFTALDLDILCDGGAYRSYSRIVAGRCVIHAGFPYRFAHLRCHFLTTFTNHVPSGSMRSFGVVKMAFALESQINELARRLGISPIEIRRINGFRDGDRMSTGQVLEDVGLTKSLDAIEPIYESRRKALAQMGPVGRKRGLGIACLGYGIGYSGTRNPSTARLRVSAEGIVTCFSGTPDIGTGSDTALAQIAAESLGIDFTRIRIVSGDSTKTDDSGPTSASRTTYFSGNAVCLAAADFKRHFLDALARKTGLPAAQLRVYNDKVTAQNTELDFEEACRLLGQEVEQVAGYGKFDPDIQVDIFTFRGNAYPTYTYATHLTEVEVDEELGSIEVLRCWTAQDGGEIVNPVGAEGQVDGGVVQGLGMALWEKVVRENGHITNPHYRDYLLPGAKDIPAEIETVFVNNSDRSGPFGAKGVAEASIIPIPGAIASAVAEAVGVRPTRLPMDAESIFRLIEKRKASAPARDAGR
jgi:CO/xanthine dehydrogenase Mo-binding subunit